MTASELLILIMAILATDDVVPAIMGSLELVKNQKYLVMAVSSDVAADGFAVGKLIIP